MRRLLVSVVAVGAVMAIPAVSSAQAPTLTADTAATATVNFVRANPRALLPTDRGFLRVLAADAACRVQTTAVPPRGLCVFEADVRSVRIIRHFNNRRHARAHSASVHGGQPPVPTPQGGSRRHRVRVLIRNFHCIGATAVTAAAPAPTVSLIRSDCLRVQPDQQKDEDSDSPDLAPTPTT